MIPDEPERPMEEVIQADGRYPPEAFNFLHDGLGKAVDETHESGGEPDPRHVTGRQLCLALRDLAVERWGRLARTVLARWNVNATIDFGNMVYLLIENKFMRKTPEDSIEDFRDVYDFADAFDVPPPFEMKE